MREDTFRYYTKIYLVESLPLRNAFLCYAQNRHSAYMVPGLRPGTMYWKKYRGRGRLGWVDVLLMSTHYSVGDCRDLGHGFQWGLGLGGRAPEF